MKDQLQKALIDFGPCSVRELYEYLRSDISARRGLQCDKHVTLETVRNNVESLVATNPKYSKFQCTSGTKVRYGFVRVPRFPDAETRHLIPAGVVSTCPACGMQVFEEDGRGFHFPARCDNYVPQSFFKVIHFSQGKAIISDAFVHGIVDNARPYALRLPKEMEASGSTGVISELWHVNDRARAMGFLPPTGLLPLKVREVTGA